VTFGRGSEVREFPSGVFAARLSLRSICIPASLEGVSVGCFSHCERLSCVTFEYGARLFHIDYEAFYGCYSLPSICIPASVTIVGEELFRDCRRLSLFTCDSRSLLSTIGKNAFAGCRCLHVIYVPESTRNASGVRGVSPRFAILEDISWLVYEQAGNMQQTDIDPLFSVGYWAVLREVFGT
jgi:hypothetical protein